VNWIFLLLLYSALTQSWNLLSGFSGQINLGLAAFFGLGSLVTRFVWLGGASVPLALALGTAAAAVAGALFGAPGLRLRGPYFAIGTLAVAEILRIITGNLFPEISPLPVRLLATYALGPRYYVALALAASVTAVAWWVTQSRLGYGLMAVREDEEVAESVGVHAFWHKLAAFVLSSFFAGMTGGLFAFYHPSYYPQFAFNPLWTFEALLIAFLGGVGTVWGPIVGAAAYLALREALAMWLIEAHLLIFGVLFVVVALAFPGGFVEAWRALAARRIEMRTSGG
jgi:branched-chain amino acid transport system permease protein